MVKKIICDPWGEAAFPVVDAYTVEEIENIFEEFRDKSGWKGLDAESAVECFIKYIRDRR